MAESLSRLALVMQALSVSNYDLAVNLKIDPSLISKWRRNKRRIPERSDTLNKIVNYLLELDRNLLESKIMPMLVSLNGSEPVAPDKARELLTRWLLESGPTQWFDASDDILNIDLDKNSYTSTIEVFNGMQGRYKAIEHFFGQVSDLPREHQLNIMLNEADDWILRSLSFKDRFMVLMKGWIGSGHGLNTIHYLDQRPHDLVDLIENWLKIHLSEDVGSFYQPLYAANQFPIVSFVVPGQAALTSHVCGDSQDQIVTILYTDQRTVCQFDWMFEFFKASCKPLIDVYKPDQSENLLNTLIRDKHLICSRPLNLQSPLPLLTSLNPDQLRDILNYNDVSDQAVAQFHNQLSTLKSLDTLATIRRYVHSLSAIEQALNHSEFEDPLLGTLVNQRIMVRREDLILSLRGLLGKIEANPQFELALTGREDDRLWCWPNMIILEGAFFISWGGKLSQNKLYSQEATLVSAFEVYFMNRWQMIPSIHRDRKENCRKLSNLVDRSKST